MDAATRQWLKRSFGLTDQDIDSITPNILKIMAGFPNSEKYRIVAEVTDAKYCAAGIKPGQRYVFAAIPPLLLSDQSDCPQCMRALGPITGFINMIMDRLAEGLDPNGAIFNTAECLDPGLGNGGLGKVRFRVYAEKKE